MEVKTDAEIKGKFIQLTGNLMNATPEYLKKANEYLLKVTGLEHHELDPEEYYATSIWDKFMTIYGEAVGDVDEAVVKLGKRVYPTIKRTAGLPDSLKTPLDYVKFEAEGYWINHQGKDVKPRRIIDEGPNHLVMYAPAPGYNEKLYVGVWLGILELIGIQTGKIEETAPHTYKITW